MLGKKICKCGQILDNLCTGHQASKNDNRLLDRLTQYKTQIAASTPGSNLAGYAYYREMWARLRPLD